MILCPVAFLWVYFKLKDRRQLIWFREQLSRMEGGLFFAYNTKHDIRRFVESEIIPRLPSQVEVLFLNGKVLESHPLYGLHSRILFSVPTRQGFPYLIRIHKQTVCGTSIRTSVFNTLKQEKSVEALMQRIGAFYSCENPDEQPQAL